MKWKTLFVALVAVMLTVAIAGSASAQRGYCRPHYRHYGYGYYAPPRAVVVVNPGYGYYHRPPVRHYYRPRYYAYYGPRYYDRGYGRRHYRRW